MIYFDGKEVKKMRIDRIKLIAEMARKRVTVKELSSTSGVSRVTITSIRAGKTCSTLVGTALARALNVPIENLLETEE